MLHLLSDWEYPHWMMMAGAIIVALGFMGFAFHRNRNGPVDEPSRAAAKGQRAMRVQRLQVERFRSEVEARLSRVGGGVLYRCRERHSGPPSFRLQRTRGEGGGRARDGFTRRPAADRDLPGR